MQAAWCLAATGGEEDATLRLLSQHFPDGILLFRSGCIFYANQSMASMAGCRDPQSLTRIPLEQLFGTEGDALLAMIQEDDPSSPPSAPEVMEIMLPREDGQSLPVEVRAQRLNLPGDPGWLMIVRDISRRQEEEACIRHQANFDTLTGLPNRALFMDRLHQELKRAARHNSHVALMFIDLDRFKWVNDTLGHAAGDALLQEAARRLLSCHRRTDTVARLGGDEFTVILPDISKGPFAERVARSILDQLARPFLLEGQEAFISGSIGITVFPDDADDLEGLLRNADNAMYRAKNDGRNTYRFFTPDMHLAAMERVSIEKDLNYALAGGQLEVHYQPIIDIVANRLVGAESYLRWRHPTRGMVPPNVFVPLAEEIGLITAIAEWALRTACQQARVWREQSDFADLFVSVNLSCTRCRDLSTGDKIQGILADSGIPPEALVLEITENILMEDEAKALAMLHQLRNLGVGIWLDDFGSGYSSLRFLQLLPVSGIKIDQVFVQGTQTSPQAAVLVEIILAMAKSLHLNVVGEGVETPEQKAFLLQHGCRLAQGYLLGRPMPADQFVTKVADWLH